MALDNLISVEFSKEEISNLNKSLQAIGKILEGKVINLTPEERQQYGRINNRTENWVTKIRDYMEQNPKLIPFYVNKDEFDKDIKARKELELLLKIANSISEGIEDTSMLLSADIYHNSIAFYRNVKMASEQNVPGSTTIYQDLAEQFPGRPNSVAGEPVPGAEVYVEQEPNDANNETTD